MYSSPCQIIKRARIVFMLQQFSSLFKFLYLYVPQIYLLVVIHDLPLVLCSALYAHLLLFLIQLYPLNLYVLAINPHFNCSLCLRVQLL